MRECPQCKGSRDECSDPDKVWHLRRDVCHKTVAAHAVKRIHDAEYADKPWHDGTFTRWAKEYSDEYPNHFADGVSVWVADTPDPKLVQPSPDD